MDDSERERLEQAASELGRLADWIAEHRPDVTVYPPDITAVDAAIQIMAGTLDAERGKAEVEPEPTWVDFVQLAPSRERRIVARYLPYPSGGNYRDREVIGWLVEDGPEGRQFIAAVLDERNGRTVPAYDLAGFSGVEVRR